MWSSRYCSIEGNQKADRYRIPFILLEPTCDQADYQTLHASKVKIGACDYCQKIVGQDTVMASIGKSTEEYYINRYR